MQKSKILIDPFVLNRISSSNKLTDTEKIVFLKHVGYLTETEKKELVQLV